MLRGQLLEASGQLSGRPPQIFTQPVAEHASSNNVNNGHGNVRVLVSKSVIVSKAKAERGLVKKVYHIKPVSLTAASSVPPSLATMVARGLQIL